MGKIFFFLINSLFVLPKSFPGDTEGTLVCVSGPYLQRDAPGEPCPAPCATRAVLPGAQPSAPCPTPLGKNARNDLFKAPGSLCGSGTDNQAEWDSSGSSSLGF